MKIKLLYPIVLCVLLSLFSSNIVCAQQDSQYTQYMFNTLTINPAYTGSRELISVSALYRSQWIALDGGPETQNITVHAPVWRKVGLGLNIVNDAIGNGTTKQTEVKANASYTVLLSDVGKLAFGLNFGGTFNSIDFGNLRIFNPQTNPGLNQVVENRFQTNIGLGLFYRQPDFYLGISNPNIFENNLFTDVSDVVAKERASWYLISGYVFETKNNILLKPAGLIKVNEGAPLQLDLSLSSLYREKLLLGASYRVGASISGLAGFYLSKDFLVGLSYDRETTALGGQSENFGTLEFFARYEFKDRKCKCTPKPRFY